jgi:hypothetical protein
MTPSSRCIVTSYRPCIASSKRRAASVRVAAMPAPSSRANTMTASMSPSLIAFTMLLGTSPTTKSTPVAPVFGGGAGAALAWASRRVLRSGDRPAPGCIRFTMPTPMSTAIVDTTIV